VRDAGVSFVLSDRQVVTASPRGDGTYGARVGPASVASVRVADDCRNSS
jgi:hypothetical protein